MQLLSLQKQICMIRPMQGFGKKQSKSCSDVHAHAGCQKDVGHDTHRKQCWIDAIRGGGVGIFDITFCGQHNIYKENEGFFENSIEPPPCCQVLIRKIYLLAATRQFPRLRSVNLHLQFLIKEGGLSKLFRKAFRRLLTDQDDIWIFAFY